MSGALRAGVAVEDATPPGPVRMSGYAGRGGPSTGCRDPLQLSALYLHDGASGALVLALDAIGLHPRDDARLRKRLAAAIGIRADAVLVACSHTHAGAATMTIYGTGAKETAWTETLFQRCVDAALRARGESVPVQSVRQGGAPCHTAINRRLMQGGEIVLGLNPSGPLDPVCRVLLLQGVSGPVAALFHYAMHPVVLNNSNRLLSADWVGAARRRIETELGCPALFLQGCCGDVNPRLREIDSAGAVERQGEEVGMAALAAAGGAAEIEAAPLGSGEARVRIPVTPLPGYEELIALESACLARSRNRSLSPGAREVARAERHWARSHRRHPRGRGLPVDHMPARVSALSIGEVTLVGLPGEVFTVIGQRVQAAIFGAWAVGYAAGNIGYLYPAGALEEGGYEVEVAYRLYNTRQAGTGTSDALIHGALQAADVRL